MDIGAANAAATHLDQHLGVTDLWHGQILDSQWPPGALEYSGFHHDNPPIGEASLSKSAATW
jgi:hypothetical protein